MPSSSPWQFLDSVAGKSIATSQASSSLEKGAATAPKHQRIPKFVRVDDEEMFIGFAPRRGGGDGRDWRIAIEKLK
jgi:hypothetical protein